MRLVPALFSVGLLLVTQGCAAPSALWNFDRLDKIGGVSARVEGAPKQIDTPAGKAVQFDGAKDALFVDTHPLAGAETWTIEAVIRPDGGAFEQRWLHLAEIDPKTGQDSATRFLFEIRVKDDRWYLDAFTTGEGYKVTLIDPSKTFALGRWYRVAMSYDGKSFKSYVDGVEQAESPLAFKPQGQGHSSIGVRMNRVNYYHGAILKLRFTPYALSPDAFEAMPQGLN
ncbi:hypothetical protein FHS83_000276 [Rhizomicrobium palustre]|uniref:LamG domain-containing protein n=1 Tax=Rhizomicrobium palustre TaxID=189966 RepID=A0A846MTX7_9PROT|nr:LamG domain-containing protein [Rhizomicrobium palustre]NIK86958.1 hypothetical protein [Rhizomicrobium palustre]